MLRTLPILAKPASPGPQPNAADPISPTPESASMARPNRWDEPFSRDMTNAVIDRILACEPFCDVDESKFPRTLSLRNILKNDSALRRYEPGEVIVRDGDYGTSAFLILDGAVRVALAPSLPANLLGRRKPHRRGWLGALAQLWRGGGIPERRAAAGVAEQHNAEQTLPLQATPSSSGAHNHEDTSPVSQERVVLSDVPSILKRHKTARMVVHGGQVEGGRLFGEIGALTRAPRSATVFAETAAELIEIRWQGLRDIMRSAPGVKEQVERTFRTNMLNVAMRTNPLFDVRHLGDEGLQAIADGSTFEMYGQFDWHTSFKKSSDRDVAQRLAMEPIINSEGHYTNGVVFIISGFARVSRRRGSSEQTTGYLGAGQLYGLAEVYHNWAHPDDTVPLQNTLRAVGYVTTLFVPAQVLEQHLFPSLPKEACPEPIVAVPEADAGGGGPVGDGPAAGTIGVDMLEFLVEHRVINGTQTMMIDMDRCTRCDDCVRACASTHDGNPRFVRHGPRHDHYMFTNACMHCADPVCMIGCPTGAIHRAAAGGEVVINDPTCIGCQQCANNCPYSNIRMVSIRDQTGHLMIDSKQLPILKATKCDLCVDQLGGPACQRACPHDALIRVDTTHTDPLAQWMKR
ncbi:MAG: 4Fe-4S dicluster domain-containing protein [Phycisphaerae bacterium]